MLKDFVLIQMASRFKSSLTHSALEFSFTQIVFVVQFMILQLRECSESNFANFTNILAGVRFRMN
jgi:hypothetical protein